jgi:hypothetical protein
MESTVFLPRTFNLPILVTGFSLLLMVVSGCEKDSLNIGQRIWRMLNLSTLASPLCLMNRYQQLLKLRLQPNLPSYPSIVVSWMNQGLQLLYGFLCSIVPTLPSNIFRYGYSHQLSLHRSIGNVVGPITNIIPIATTANHSSTISPLSNRIL